MNLAQGLSDLALPFELSAGSSPPLVDLSAVEFCDPAATVALAAFGAHHHRRTRQRVELAGWNPDSYLARVGVKRFAGYEDDYKHRRQDDDRLTSIIEVADSRERAKARTEVLDVLGIRHEGARLVLDYCVEEVLRNVEDHADSPVNALLQAQYYQSRSQVVLAIGDTGRGILWNLRQRHAYLENDEAALRAALAPGMSGRNTRKGTNAGLGLTVTSRLVTGMGGTFQIASGDSAVLALTDDQAVVHKLSGTRWPGVLVAMCVPRDDSLDWEGTFTEVMGAV